MPHRPPIFVAGFQRSGTTLLQSLLGAHPRIAAPPEVHYFLRIADLARHWGDLSDDGRLRRVVHELLHPPVPLFADCGFDEHALFKTIARTDRSYASILDAFMSDFAARQGKPRWSEKSPGQPPARVWTLFPTAQVVHIVRDPRAVVASSLKTPWTDGDAVIIARQWKAFVARAWSSGWAAGPRRFLPVRYEDLASDPDAVLRLVCTFLGEDYDPTMVTEVERRRSTVAPAAAPWQRKALEPVQPADEHPERLLARLDRVRIAGAVVPWFEALGYPPPRRRAVWAGRAINLVPTAKTLSHQARLMRMRRAITSPEGHYREVRRHLERTALTLPNPNGDRPSTVGPPRASGSQRDPQAGHA